MELVTKKQEKFEVRYSSFFRGLLDQNKKISEIFTTAVNCPLLKELQIRFQVKPLMFEEEAKEGKNIKCKHGTPRVIYCGKIHRIMST